MRHDVFEKQIVNAVAGRGEVLSLQHGTQVLDDRQRTDIPQHVLHERRRLAIPRVDHRHLVLPAEPGLRLGGSDQFRKLHDVRLRPAIGSSREQDHVGPQLANPLNLLERLPLVVGGERLHHDRAGSEGRSLGTGGGHLPHDARDQHLQAAPRAGRGDVDVAAILAASGPNKLALLIDQPPPRQLAHFGRRVGDAHGDIGRRFLDRRRRFAPVRLPVHAIDLLDQNGLRGRAATVGGKDHVE